MSGDTTPVDFVRFDAFGKDRLGYIRTITPPAPGERLRAHFPHRGGKALQRLLESSSAIGCLATFSHWNDVRRGILRVAIVEAVSRYGTEQFLVSFDVDRWLV